MSSHLHAALPDDLGPVNWDHPSAVRPTLAIDPKTGLRRPQGKNDPPQRKKVAIVGFCSTTMALAPFNDPDYEIWGMNQLYRRIPRADRWFEIHANYDEFVVEGTDHIQWLKDCPIPIYMVDAFPQFPKAVPFPIESFTDAGNYSIDYFTSSIAYMLALAYLEGFETVAVYGVDLSVGIEYIRQRPCAEFWLARLFERKVRLEIPKPSALLKQVDGRYGYRAANQEPKVTMEEYDARIAHLEAQKAEALKMAYMYDGALQEAHFYKNALTLRLNGAEPSIGKPQLSPQQFKQQELAQQLETQIKEIASLKAELAQRPEPAPKPWDVSHSRTDAVSHSQTVQMVDKCP